LEGDDRDAILTQAARTEDLFAVSAITGDGMDALLAAVPDKLKDPRTEETLSLAFADGRKRAWLFEQGIVTHETQTEIGYDLTVFWTGLQKERFVRL
jgi:GTP-binding protein HflX